MDSSSSRSPAAEIVALLGNDGAVRLEPAKTGKKNRFCVRSFFGQRSLDWTKHHEELKKLASESSIVEFDVSNETFGDQEAICLAASASVEKMQVNSETLGTAGLVAIASMPSLHSLNVACRALVTSAGLILSPNRTLFATWTSTVDMRTASATTR